MVVQESVTDQEGIAAGISSLMAKLGLSARPPPLGREKKQSSSELDYIFED